MQESTSDGCTLKDQLMSAYRQTGIKHDLLVGCELPADLEYVWHWFLELNATRQYSDNGNPQGTMFGEILAWSQLMIVKLTPNETSIIHKLDKIAVNRLAPKKTK